MRLLIIFLFIYGLTIAQKDTATFNLDNSLSGSLIKNDGKIQGFSRIFSQNTIEYNKLMVNLVTNYQINYQGTINGNELLNKTNLNYGDIFCSHVYSYSLIRQMRSDNSFGFGYSYKYKFKNISYGISYAFIGQQTNYFNKQITGVLRHSLRLKFKYDNRFFLFYTEFYLQPNVKTIKDQIIYGTIKLTLLPKTKVNLILQDNINYFSLSSIKTIHTFTFGIGHSIIGQKKLKNKRL